ncbi:2-C-methyl-D-erythritol 4-phosphate cytidylyltransferase [[Leptolyngbya] sp. PCC 7376]|uniref:2-C-methyl-D-erythritol 4-phosphate cytidylyltransferase n=1 Tax=[Leptolyngbya] sp. PCC 7376 TaxID=111781 RepID=UPI0005A1A7D0|nr:2-C-methyl-D-erythritol 4-phosphate cytidylyltransferase [[Leptolyngbya] sp. PCC 7376]
MHLLLPAAGVGKRMGGDRNKLLLPLRGEPLFAWTLKAAEAASSIGWIGIIGQPVDFPDFESMLSKLQLTKSVNFIQGGSTRQESVYNGLQALPDDAEAVLIHDGARCLATAGLFNRCATALESCDGLIAAVPVKDTIKVVGDAGIVKDTPDRSALWAAQTPQGFKVQQLKECHDQGKSLGWEVTDDAALFERCGLPVKIVEGEETNLKITTPVDLAIAEFILQRRIDQTP